MTQNSESSCSSCGAPLSNAAAERREPKPLCPICVKRMNELAEASSINETIVTYPTEQHEGSFDKTRSLESGQSSDEILSLGVHRKCSPEYVGRFQIRQTLGSGNFGTVYRAYDPLLDREVALKVPRLDSDDQRQFERFLREAKAAARLRHPNIVAVFECGVADGEPFIASEFVDGVVLSELLKQGGIEIRRAVDLTRQVAEAIHYAHTEGIVHRDLKPGNIMMSKTGRPQIMDFGLAKLSTDSDKSLSSEGHIVGTPAFMAPEQARGDSLAVGPKSDQYSVGVLLYVLLCGRRPYLGDTWSIISRVADPVHVPEPPRKICSDVPRDLEACCLKAMEKEPSQRYHNLDEMAEDLAHWLEGRPLRARPIGWRERLVRWGARNRLIASLLAVISGFILTATVVGFLLAWKFSTMADAEKTAKREVERVLIDTFTESGLEAGRNGRDQEAVLWFASAAVRATEHPHRELMNRTRFQSWLTRTPIPVRMFRGLGHWHESLSVHPSGQYVLSEQHSAPDEHCQIWNVSAGTLMKLPWDAMIGAATWNADGTLLALASGAEVRTFRFPDLLQVEQWSQAEPVKQLLFTRDGKHIAVGCYSSAIIRELAKDSTRAGKVIPVPAAVLGMAWNDSGTTLATLCQDEKVYVWNTDPADASTEPMMKPVSSSVDSEPSPLQFLDDQRLVVAKSDKAVACWNIASGECAWSVPCEEGYGFAVSPDRKRLAIMDRYNLIQVDANTGRVIQRPVVHSNRLYAVAYDSTGKRLLTGCGDQFARIYSAETQQPIASMRHSDIVHRVAWFPGGNACVTAHWKADLVRVWRHGMPSEPGFSQVLPTGVMHVKWSKDGRQFLPTGMDLRRGAGPYHILSKSDGKPVGDPVAFPGRVSDACFLGDGRTVVMGGSQSASSAEDSSLIDHQDLAGKGLIVIADVATGQPLFPPIETDTNVVAVETSPDGRVVAALCYDHKLLLIDPVKPSEPLSHQTFPGKDFFHQYVIFRRLAFSPKGDRFAVWGSRSRTAEIRSATNGDLLFSVSHENETNTDWLHDVVFSPDGSTIATCSADQTVQLWNSATGAPLSGILWHTGWVFSAKFSHDGKQLLTACQDRQARLWDLEQPGKPLLITPPQADEVYATCFLPGDEAFLIGLRNGEVSAWDSIEGKMIAPATREPGQEAVYSIDLCPDQSRVIVVSQDPSVRGFAPSRWLPVVDHELTSSGLQALGEMIASEELHNGVLLGLTSDAVMERWKQLMSSHGEHPIFRWPAPLVFTADTK